MKNEKSTELKRAIGILDVAVNVVNLSIASGIFLLPALIAGILGNASFMAYILCGTLFLWIALCYAEASSRITVLKIIPLVLLVGVGLFHLKSDHFHWEKLPTLLGDYFLLWYGFFGGDFGRL